MRCRLGVGEGAVGKAQRIVHSPEDPQRNRIKGFRCSAGIPAEPVGEVGIARRVVELDGLLKMLMGAGKVAEIPAGHAGDAVRDQGLGAIRPVDGLALEKLGHFAQRCGFAARKVPDPETVIDGKPFEASSTRLANSRARANAALVSGA